MGYMQILCLSYKGLEYLHILVSKGGPGTSSPRILKDDYPHVHFGIIYKSHIWKQPKYPWAEYSAIKKKGVLPFVTTWMDLEGTMLCEISQTEKDKNHMISILCRI